MAFTPRRDAVRWASSDLVISREQDGHRCYRVTVRIGDRIESSFDFDNADDAQRHWVALQRSVLDGLETLHAPALPDPPSQLVDLTDIDDDPQYQGEYPPLGGRRQW